MYGVVQAAGINLWREDERLRNSNSLTDYLLHSNYYGERKQLKDYLENDVFSDDRMDRLSPQEVNGAENMMAQRINHLATVAGAAMCFAPITLQDTQYVMPELNIKEMTSIGVAMAMLIMSAMQSEIMLDTQMEAIKGTQNQKLSASNTTISEIKQQIRKSYFKSRFQKFMEWLSGTGFMKFLSSQYGKIVMFLITAIVTAASLGTAGPAMIAINCALLGVQAAELIIGKSMGELITQDMDDGALKQALQMAVDIGLMVASLGASMGSGAEKAVEESTEKVVEKVVEETTKQVVEEAAKEVAKQAVEAAGKELAAGAAKEAAKDIGEKVDEKVTKELTEKFGVVGMKALGEEAVKAAAKKAGEEAGKAVAEELTKELTKTLGEEAAKEIAQEVGQEVAKNTAKEVAKSLGTELGEDVAEKIGEEAGKEAAESIGKKGTEEAGEIGKKTLEEGADDAVKDTGKATKEGAKDATEAGGKAATVLEKTAQGLSQFSNIEKAIMTIQRLQQWMQSVMQIYQALYQLALSEEEIRNITYAATVDAIRTKSDAQQEFYQMLIDNLMADIQTLMSYTKASYERAAEAIKEQGDTNMAIARNLVI
jgi:hypothetical protein